MFFEGRPHSVADIRPVDGRSRGCRPPDGRTHLSESRLIMSNALVYEEDTHDPSVASHHHRPLRHSVRRHGAG